MYKAILCDDNEIIVQGLSEIIPWEKLQIDFRGCCTDGLAARKLLEKENPDILISDVQMPFVDGLTLTQEAKKRNPDIEVIIISGYDDFRYAQEAIKLGVKDYLLKPIDPKEMIVLLERAVKECRQRETQKALFSADEKNRKHEQIRCLIYDGLETFEVNFGSECLNQLKDYACAVGVLSIDNFEQLNLHMTAREQQEIQQLFFRCIKKYAPSFRVYERRDGTAFGYFLESSPKRVRQLRETAVTAVRTAFHTVCPSQTVTFAGSRIRGSVLELQKSHRETLLALQERYVYSPGSNIYFEQIDTGKEFSTGELDMALVVSELISLIRLGDREAVRCEVDRLRRQLLRMGGGKSYIFMKFFTSSIFVGLFQDLQQYGIENMDLDITKEYQRITETQSVEQAMELLYQYAVKIMDAIECNSQNSNVKTIIAACEYIEKHYMEHTLSMDDVAREVHMSPSYFSVIFKRETGVSFTDYLIRLRIQKSQELMRCTDLRIYEISAKVGYDTAAYYSTAFKKETGISPTQYKKGVMNGELPDENSCH